MFQIDPCYKMKIVVTVECLDTGGKGEREVELENVHVKGLMLTGKGGIELLIKDAVALAHADV